MKHLYLFSLYLFISSTLLSQTPEAFKYQAVVRDNSGNLITDQAVGIQIEILKGATDGTSVYSETHSVTTNGYGLINLEIGSGTTTDDLGNINWGEDDYFIQVSLDATGGTSYELMGTSQLLSVPYSMHSSVADSVVKESQILEIEGDILSISQGNSITLPSGGTNPPTGKSIVVFRGDITDAEAAEKVANEVGTNTQYIWVKNTTQLTTLNLTGLTDLVEFQARDNSALQSITFSDLISCRLLSLSQNPSLTTLDAGLLFIVSEIAVSTCNNLSIIDLSSLESAVNYVNFEDCPAMVSLNLDSYTDGGLMLSNCSISNLSAPKLIFADRLMISNCASLATLDISNLKKVNGTFSLGDSPLLSSITLNLESATNFTIGGCPSINTLNLSTLESADNLSVSNVGISTISFPNLQSNTNIRVNNCSALSSIDISNILGMGAFEAQNNALPSAEINSLLAYFVSLLPDAPSYIWLNGQTPTAPPTGQGITDKATLIANGKNVLTD